jgi:hypothetical protein
MSAGARGSELVIVNGDGSFKANGYVLITPTGQVTSFGVGSIDSGRAAVGSTAQTTVTSG